MMKITFIFSMTLFSVTLQSTRQELRARVDDNYTYPPYQFDGILMTLINAMILLADQPLHVEVFKMCFDTLFLSPTS